MGHDRSGFIPAVTAAAGAEVAIVVVGGRSGLQRDATVGEARDAVDLRLTGVQGDWLNPVATTGSPTVAVVMSGRAHVLADLVGSVQALLVAWPLGEQGGNTLADVLLGHAEPAGRGTVTLPRATGQVPRYSSHRSGGSASVFYTHYTDCEHTPLFSFGHGLGYTTFSSPDIAVRAGSTSSSVIVEVTVTNAGERSGEEVVQLYASDLVASVARPEAALIGFARLNLPPEDAARVTFDVHPSQLRVLRRRDAICRRAGPVPFFHGPRRPPTSDQQAVVELTGPVASYSQRSIVVCFPPPVGYVGAPGRSAAKA